MRYETPDERKETQELPPTLYELRRAMKTQDEMKRDKRIIQITSGRGPAECCWVVAQVLKFLMQEAREAGIEASVVHRQPGPEDRTLYSAVVEISGSELKGFLDNWLGTVLWIGQSPYRKYHKRKNWYVGVEEVDLEADNEMRDQDITYTAIRAGGPGGQHVNKVSTAIRATHKPTDLTVVASDQRSQAQNKKMARYRLCLAIEEQQSRDLEQKARDNWQQHNELQRGNPVRTFSGSNFKKQKTKDKSFKHRRQELKRDTRRENDET